MILRPTLFPSRSLPTSLGYKSPALVFIDSDQRVIAMNVTESPDFISLWLARGIPKSMTYRCLMLEPSWTRQTHAQGDISLRAQTRLPHLRAIKVPVMGII